MKLDIHRLLHKGHVYLHVACHKTEHVLHCTYLGLVYKEAHGYYGMAAGGMLVVILINAALSIHTTAREHTEVHNDAEHSAHEERV